MCFTMKAFNERQSRRRLLLACCQFYLQIVGFGMETFDEGQTRRGLILACRQCYLQIVRFGMEAFDKGQARRGFILTCRERHLQIVRFGMEAFHEGEARRRLILVCRQRHLQIVRFPMEAFDEGQTRRGLVLASRESHQEIVWVRLQAGGWAPRNDQPLDPGNQQEEANAQDGAERNRREDALREHLVCRAHHVDPKTPAGANQFGQHRADHAIRRGDTRACEYGSRAPGRATLRSTSRSLPPIARTRLAYSGSTLQSLVDRAHNHRKDADQRHNHDLWHYLVAKPDHQ